MSEVYFIKNWFRFQHYKDRNPPWIKLHRSILHDQAVQSLKPHERWWLICIWFYASENEGTLAGHPRDICRISGICQHHVAEMLLAKLETIGLISKQDIRGHVPDAASIVLDQRQRQRQSKKDNPPTPLEGDVVFPFSGNGWEAKPEWPKAPVEDGRKLTEEWSRVVLAVSKAGQWTNPKSAH